MLTNRLGTEHAGCSPGPEQVRAEAPLVPDLVTWGAVPSPGRPDFPVSDADFHVSRDRRPKRVPTDVVLAPPARRLSPTWRVHGPLPPGRVLTRRSALGWPKTGRG